jgi:hypothetical protein
MVAANGNTKPQPAPASQQRAKRMTLASITKGRHLGPKRVLLHGVDGVGKSTFGANAPKPVFLGAEDGTEHLDVARFPLPHTWQDVLDAIRELAAGGHDYETLVVDTLDWAEPLLWKHVCETAKVSSIEDVGGGYGKGFSAALDGWRVLLADLERLQRERGLHVILLAHSFIKKFANPEGDDFDRYILKLNEKAAALVREWCKGVYFANYETFAVKDKQKRVRGVSTGARLLYTQRTAAYDAKDRYGLPESLPLSWEEFAKAVEAGCPADPKVLLAEIQRKAADLGGDIERMTLELIPQFKGDGAKLAQLNDRLNAKLGERRDQTAAIVQDATAV